VAVPGTTWNHKAYQVRIFGNTTTIHGEEGSSTCHKRKQCSMYPPESSLILWLRSDGSGQDEIAFFTVS
ncbi:MAG TPA: hypothetical protein VJ350_08340, partial [Methanoregula sp.]|nr:hypothetical protein [Methanoregula sp.]